MGAASGPSGGARGRRGRDGGRCGAGLGRRAGSPAARPLPLPPRAAPERCGRRSPPGLRLAPCRERAPGGRRGGRQRPARAGLRSSRPGRLGAGSRGSEGGRRASAGAARGRARPGRAPGRGAGRGAAALASPGLPRASFPPRGRWLPWGAPCPRRASPLLPGRRPAGSPQRLARGGTAAPSRSLPDVAAARPGPSVAPGLPARTSSGEGDRALPVPAHPAPRAAAGELAVQPKFLAIYDRESDPEQALPLSLPRPRPGGAPVSQITSRKGLGQCSNSEVTDA